MFASKLANYKIHFWSKFGIVLKVTLNMALENSGNIFKKIIFLFLYIHSNFKNRQKGTNVDEHNQVNVRH